jgi:hypothetical protein
MKIDLDGLKETLKTFKVSVVKETDKAIVVLAGKGIYLTSLPLKNGTRKRVIGISFKTEQQKKVEIVDPELFGCEARSGKGLEILIRTLPEISSGDS